MVDLKSEAELREAIELLYFAYRGFTERADRILERRGLGRTHHRILYFVGRDPDLQVRDLLKVLAVSKQALNAPLRQLLEMGLVAALPGAKDRRVRNLQLTGEGRRLEAELTGAQARYLDAAFRAAGPLAEQGWRAVMADLSASAAGTRP
ncbi:MAG: MarR family transcriptional regulator [Caulobacteraceae bacterium]|nr:MarR family transcriptional regulator [Caulobacteraceae bacterium]